MVQGFMKWEKESKIILGLDIGTIQSAVSYALLFKGDEASVKRVSKWPEQAKHQEGSKVPTQIYYNDDGQAVKCGAETTTNDAETLAEDENWRLAKYFKLHLHPPTMRAQNDVKVEPLPDGVSLRQIYVDFMKYLLRNTKNYIWLYEPYGERAWMRYSPSMDIVIAHPHGWGVEEQGFLRDVAVEAGYCSSEGAATQIHFVREAEASFHFCITYAGFSRVLKPGIEFIVCDAGGSTFNTTAYSVITDGSSLSIEERNFSSCVQAGGILVDEGARLYLSQVLGKSGLDADTLYDYVKKGVEEFEATAKRQFSGSEEYISIKVGDRRFSDTEAIISRGKMKLQRETMKSFYHAPVNDILKAVENQLSGLSAEYILLVGGFGESRYLRTCIENRFKAKKFVYADDGKSKAVADGAVIWIAKGAVSRRAVRFAYGIEIRDWYSETNPDRHEYDIQTTRQEEKQRAEKGWGDKIEEIKKTSLYEKQTLHRELENALKARNVLEKELQEAHAQELETLARAHSQEIQDIQISLKSARKDYTSLLGRMNSQIRDAATTKQQAQDVQAAYQSEVQRAEQQYNKMMETNTRAVNELRTQLESTQALLEEKRRAEESWIQKYDKMKGKNSGEIQDMRTDLESTRTFLEGERRVAESWKQKYERMGETNARRFNDIHTELESTRAHLEESRRAEESWEQKYQGMMDTKSQEVQDIHTKLESTQALLKEKLKAEDSWKDKLQDTQDAHVHEINSLNTRFANSEKYWKDQFRDAYAEAEASWSNKFRDSQEAHTREVNSLNARYTEAERSWSNRFRDSKEIYNHDIDSLNSRYTVVENQLRDSQQAHARDVDTINAHHIKVKSQLQEAQEAYARDVDSLNARYTKAKDQLHDLQEAHSREIDSLDALHAKDKKSLEKQLQDSQEAHVRELASLNARYKEAEESWENQLRDSQESHARQIDSLNTHHTKVRDQLRDAQEAHTRDMENVHAQEIDYLSARYAQAQYRLQSSEEAHAHELNSLNARYAKDKEFLNNQLQESVTRDMLNNYRAKVESWKDQLQNSHSQEIKGIREGAQKEYDAPHDRMTRQIQDINVQHDQNIQLVRREEEDKAEKLWEKKLERALEKGSRDIAVGQTTGPDGTTMEKQLHNSHTAIFDMAAENPGDLAVLVQNNKVQHDNVTHNIPPDAFIASPTYHDARTVQCKTANAAYSHAMRVEHTISNALAKSGLHGSYFIQAGFNEELVSNGTGTLEEIYIYLDCELPTNRDDLTAILNRLGQILAPFPGTVYTIKGMHYILPEADPSQCLQLAKNAGIYTQGFKFSKNHAGESSAASGLSGSQGIGSENSDSLDSSEGGSSGQRDVDKGVNGNNGGGDGGDGGDDDDDDDDDNGSNDSGRYHRPKRQDPKNLSIPFQSRVTIKDVRKTPLSTFTVSAITNITLVEGPRHMGSSQKDTLTSYPDNWCGPWFGLQIPFVSTNFANIDGGREDPYHLSVAQICVNASSCPCSLLSFSPQDTSSTDDAVKVKSERKASGGVSVTLSALPGAKLAGSVGQASSQEMIERKWRMMTFPCFGDSGENWVMWKYILNKQHHDAWAPTVTFEPGPKIHFGNKLRSRRPQLEVELVMYWSAFSMSKKDLPFWLRQWFTRTQGKEDPKAPGGFANMLHQVSVCVDLEKLTSSAWVVGLNKIDEAKQSDIDVNLSRFEPVTVKADSEDRRLQCEVVLQRALHGRIQLRKEDRMSDQPLSPSLSQNKSRKVS